MTRIFAALGAFAIACAGCSSGAARPPTARIAVAPAYVPLGDHYTTDVVLDGTASADAIDDPDAQKPLGYFWVVDDSGATIIPGPGAAKITVRVAGAAPTSVHLTVTNGDGDTNTANAIIGVTVPN